MSKGYPKFRQDLIISRQEFDKVIYYVIKDPVTRKFFRIKEFEHFITQNLDGLATPEEMSRRFQEQFNIPLPPETLDRFIRRMESLGFLEGEVSQRELAHLQYQKKTIIGRLLFLKLKGFDPDRLLDRLVKRTRFLFTPTFLIFSLFILSIGIIITVSNWSELGYSFQGIFRLGTIVEVWIAVFVVVLLHEFAHGLTCKYFGGEVHEMGFLLLYFQPCFYCNVSDAYLFKEKSKRLWVTFAGAYCQVFLWALATILWRITAPDTGWGRFLFVVVITSGVTVLFNFNPLIKLDGYYLLTDYLEIPNLRQKAFGYVSSLLKRKFLRQNDLQAAISSRERRVYLSYGIFSLLYSALLLLFVLFKAERFLVSQLGGFGFILFLLAVFLILRQPAQTVTAGIVQFVRAKRTDPMLKKKTTIYGGIVLALALILVLARMELKVGGGCQIKALEYFTLRTLSDGTVTSELFQGGAEEKKAVNLLKLFSTDFSTLNLVTKVKEGQKVDTGQVVAELTSPSYASNLEEAKESLIKAENNYTLLRKGATKEAIQQAKEKVAQTQSELSLNEKQLKRYSDLHEKNLISSQELEQVQTEHAILSNQLEIAKNDLKILKNGSRPEELSMALTETRTWQSRLEFLEGQVSDSQIKSPIHGIVTSISREGNLLNVSNIDTVRVLIEVSEKDLDVLKEGQPVKLKVQSYPFLSFWGKVARISQMADLDGSKNIFPVTCKIENQGYLLKPGMTGYAKVFCGKRSLFHLLTRRIVRYLRVEVWSWW
ncbi:MAG: efflux RND transporter periplasmic adaptor subunit [Candidatus Zixiibacteriota bacterium]